MANNADQEEITLVYDSVLSETDLAYLISFGPGTEVWILKNISILNAKYQTITMPLWLAEDKEIEMYEE